MKKVYTIQITNLPIVRKGIWYADKNNRKYEAELKVRPGTMEVMFYVNMGQFVYPIDCTVVGERLVEIYKKP